MVFGFKQYTITLVFAVYPFSVYLKKVRADCLIGFGIMCPIGAPCLHDECYFSELELQK